MLEQSIEDSYSRVYEEILRSIKANNLDCLEIITVLLCIQCSVCISIKQSKKDFIELLNNMLSKIPADEFYDDEEA